MANIQEIVKKYFTRGLLLICVLFALGIIVDLFIKASLSKPLILSFAFSALTINLYGIYWRHIAMSSPKSLTLFYMAGIVMRTLLSLPFLIGYWMYAKTFEEMLSFVITFMVFYLVVLFYDTVYFARVERHNKFE